ncbi:hypothetical protein [Streptomyces sp. CC224B]|uniref:hypothetical protein n=1 Tax=Streptomyces sp. CC224B TaxID=3044571 RepID=UPI0024A90C03|nr:hypothetical protein [Streptomyces sp. CC224B]
MPRHLRAVDIDAVLDAYPASEWSGDGWIPGWRTAQDGRRQVLVFHDGPGEQDGLDTYRLALQGAGFHVVPDQQPGGGRRRLHITRP